MKSGTGGFVLLGVVLVVSSSSAWAAPREMRVPLRDGKLRVSDVSASLGESMRIPRSDWLRKWDSACDINLSGFGGSLFVHALNEALGEGCTISQDADALVIRFDTEKLPHSVAATKQAVRTFTAEAAPDATAKQQRNYGLLMPTDFDSTRPLVILVHGMDCKGHKWHPMGELLGEEGYQVAYFTYPSDQPIEDSAALLGRDIAAIWETFGPMRVDVIGHSLGALVARTYVEGDDYIDSAVRKLILIAPPNHGTQWARARWFLELEEHYYQWKNDPDWSLSWSITDGLGEAGAQIKPKSDFLQDLNSRPRRENVQYTIIAGAENPVWRKTANCFEKSAHIVPDGIEHWWGLRHYERGMQKAADSIRARSLKSDGPVAVNSTYLDGVEDFVAITADHGALYYPEHGDAPAAWETIRDRLAAR